MIDNLIVSILQRNKAYNDILTPERLSKIWRILYIQQKELLT